MRRRSTLLLIAALGGCNYVTSSLDKNDFSGDEFPIAIDRSTGGILVGLQQGNENRRTAVLDVLSPMTLVDRGPDTKVRIDSLDINLLGANASTGELDVPRARFPEKQVATLHPCKTPTCTIGTPTNSRGFDALVGLNIFSSDALRLRLGSDQIFVLPNIAGDDTHRSRACDAVFPSPFNGGGTLLIGGAELDFSSWRIVLDSCLAPNPDPTLPQAKRGTDALLVLSTAIGISILDETTYNRYRELDPTTIPDLATLTEDSVFLPSGAVVGRVGSIPSIALVGNSSANPRAPCRQVWTSHLLAERDCQVGDDCPCTSGDTFCAAPAIVELTPPSAMIPVLVVSDAEPVLQALRAELRPDEPEVDGILGADALTALELDIDYGHPDTSHIFARCTDRTACAARTSLGDREARFFVNGCLGN